MASEPLDRLPPHDADAERNALACALEKPELFAQLHEHHFYDHQARILFRVGTQIEADGGRFDLVELYQRLKDHQDPEARACASIVTTLLVPSAANFPTYFEVIEDRATRRAQIHDAQVLLARAFDTSLPLKPGNKYRLAEILENRSFSPVKMDEPPPRFYLARAGVCTAGNLTTISAQAKSGKTAIVGAAISSIMAQTSRDCLGWQADNNEGHAVVHFDTEQSLYDHWQLIDRAMRRAGVESTPAWLRSFCVTGFSCKDTRQAIQLSLDQAAQKFGGVHSFILDGAADCVVDVNDAAESNDFVAELHALAIQYDCPILGVIHLNPGSDSKTRGHLGSQLERKAETNIRLDIDSDGVTIIWADKNRRAPILKKSGPRFTWSPELGMHAIVAGNGQTGEAGQLAEQLHEAFRIAEKSALHWADLVTALQRVPGITSKRTAERIHSKAKALGVIKTNLLKQWTLT